MNSVGLSAASCSPESSLGTMAAPAVATVAEEKKVRLIANQSDMSAFAPKAQLAAVTPRWGGYYTQVARDVLAGRWKVAPVWGGLRSGMVDLTALDPKLPARQTQALQAARRSLSDERTALFAAPLIDQQGRTRLERGALDDAAIAKMDWLVQVVIGSAPKP